MNLIKLGFGIAAIAASVSASFYWPDVPPTPENVLRHSLGSAPGAGAVCVDQRLLHCQANFNKYLGINGNIDWKVPLDFYQALLKIYSKNGTQGFLQVCQAYTAFARCLGNMYAACNNPLFYLQHGYTIITAAYYPAVLAQLHFQCGGGLETAIYNWKCITNTGATYNRTIVNCNTGYAINSSIDPAHACMYAANDMQCVRAPFQAQCGGPTGWYLCEYTRVGLAAHLPMCTNLRCRVGSSSEPEEPPPVLNLKKDKISVDQLKKDHDFAAVDGLGKGTVEVLDQFAQQSLKEKKKEA